MMDQLDLIGELLFAGEVLDQQCEHRLRDSVAPAYRQLRSQGLHPSALRLRRSLTIPTFGITPELGRPGEIRVADDRADPLVARLFVPYIGARDLFHAGLEHGGSAVLPTGEVDAGDLILAVRFSPNNAPFVPALLQAELMRVEECLAQLSVARHALDRAAPALVKRIVAEQWPSLAGSRGG